MSTLSAKHSLPLAPPPRASWRKLLNLLIILALLYVLLPQLGHFRASWAAVRHASIDWLVVALAATAGTYFMAAAVYKVLAVHPLRYYRTLLTQFASMFANRLLPAGIGAISVNFVYLRQARHSKSQAAAIVLINNSLGLIGHILLLLVLLLGTNSAVQPTGLHIPALVYWLVLASVIIVLSILQFGRLRQRLQRGVLDLAAALAGYRTQLWRLGLGLIFSLGITLFYAVCLLASERAVGVHLTFVQTLIVLTVGVIGGVVTPTPGGLIGAEAGLVAGLVVYQVSSSNALAITLVYRFLTYWLPLVLGGLAFQLARHRKYF